MIQNLTEIIAVLDRSGSMRGLEGDVIGGFNKLIDDQKKVAGSAIVTLVLFDDHYEVVYSGRDIQSVPELTKDVYYTRGMTALFDAMGKTITDVGIVLAATAEERRPGKVIMFTVTDGQENASREFNFEQLKKMIDHQKTKYSWEFLFLSADLDSFNKGNALGVVTAMFANTSNGNKRMYDNLSCSLTNYRSGGTVKAEDLNTVTVDNTVKIQS